MTVPPSAPGPGNWSGRVSPQQSLPLELERSLVERAQRNDQEALGRLYDAYIDRLYRFCLARVGNETDAEDLAEEIFLKVLGGIGGFTWRPLPDPPGPAGGGTGGAGLATGRNARYSEPRSPFNAWLFRIARNHVISFHRRHAVRGPVIEPPEWIEDDRRGPQELAETKLTIEEVFAAVQELPEAQREVILLRFGAGLSVAETAESLGKQQTNVKVLQHKGVQRLKEMLLEGPPKRSRGGRRDERSRPVQ